MVLVIKKRFLDAVVRHCEDAFPVEACGILTGRFEGERKVVEKVYRTRNILNSSYAYRVDPEEQYRVFTEAEGESMEVLGFYHSHPFWPAEVSATDRSWAFYTGFSYLIYSIPEKNLKSFVPKDDMLKEEEVQLV